MTATKILSRGYAHSIITTVFNKATSYIATKHHQQRMAYTFHSLYPTTLIYHKPHTFSSNTCTSYKVTKPYHNFSPTHHFTRTQKPKGYSGTQQILHARKENFILPQPILSLPLILKIQYHLDHQTPKKLTTPANSYVVKDIHGHLYLQINQPKHYHQEHIPNC